MDEQQRTHLAESGERLALCAQQLGSGEATVEDLFAAAEAHISALEGAGVHAEAFATAVMALLTAFGARFNPEEHAAPYLMLLLRMAIDAAVAMQIATMQGDTFAQEHYAAIDAELGPLVLKTYQALGDKAALPENMRAPFEQLGDWVDANATFGDQPIEATLAADILYDIASRLTAMGVIE